MNYVGSPVFKGLQRPLEFMGIRGRFLTFAAMAIGFSFVGFIVFSIAMGKLAGFVAQWPVSPSFPTLKLRAATSKAVTWLIG